MAALTIVLLVLGGVFAGVFVMAFIAGGEVAQLEQENTDLALELAAMKQQRRGAS